MATTTPSNSPASQALSRLMWMRSRSRTGVGGVADGKRSCSCSGVGRANPEHPDAEKRRSPRMHLTLSANLARFLEVGESDLREVHLRLGAGLALDGRHSVGGAALSEELDQLHLKLHHVAREDRPQHFGADGAK